MSTTTISSTAAINLIAAGIDLSEVFPNGVVISDDAVTTPAPKKDGRNHAARKHNHDARIARRNDSSRKGGAGMTKAEKSELYAALIEENGGERPTTAQWNRACKKARGL
jgi:hypothetical protein